MQPELIILGIGSPFGADRLGWEVIDLLKKDKKASSLTEKTRIEACDRPGMSLAQYIRTFPKAILIDAIVADKPPGTIITLDGHNLEQTGSPLSSHGHGITDALQLGATLGWLPPQLTVMGMVVAPDSEELPTSKQLEALTQAVLTEAGRMLWSEISVNES
jgi:hydrogenase maturation protease